MTLDSSPPTAVLAGTESLLIQCGELLLERGWRLAVIVSSAAEIVDWANRHALSVAAPGRGLTDELRGVEFDWFMSITNLSIIPEEVISMARRGALNFHDGPLPRYAGMYTPAWAILNGETEYGVTFHEMTAGVDEGDILVQRLFPLSDEETSLSLNTSCYANAIDAFNELAQQLAEESLAPRAQDLSARSYFGRHERPEAAGILDWALPAEVVARWVRAMDFGSRYPNPFGVAKVMHGGRVARVQGARAVALLEASPAGTLVRLADEGWTVSCGEGAVLLSGFGSPRGQNWTPLEAAKRLGLGPGDIVGSDASFSRTALTEENSRLISSERFWRRRLTELVPIEAPHRRVRAGETEAEGSDKAASDLGRVESISFPTGSAFAAEADEARVESLIAAFLIHLGRLQGLDRFDVTWSEDALIARVAPFGELFSAWLPLSVSIEREARGQDGIANVRSAIAKARERGTFLVDVIARDPALAAHPLVGGGIWTSVAVGIHAQLDTAELAPGVDLALAITPDAGEARLLYNPDTMDRDAVARLPGQFAALLPVLEQEELPVGRLPLMDAAERRRVLQDWNQTAAEFDRSATIRSLFEQRVSQSPEDVAAVFEGESLSYRELDARANRLAKHLDTLGVAANRLVGLHLARSLDMVVGVLGVLKAGGAYVPLDPVYPEDRLAYMIEDSGAEVVLTHPAANAAVPSNAATIVDLEQSRETIAALPDARPEVECRPEDLAYVIYTSGSTGKPKGVMVENRNAVNFFVGMDDCMPHDPPGTWLAVTSLSFDISVLELLWTLTRGFEVVVFADRNRAAASEEAVARPWRGIDLGLALWGSDAGPGPRKYELMLEAAKFADVRGFCAVHTPERHFGAFGGPFPNSSVTSAAIAAVTERVQIRASSCVLPLHHPVRVAEEWAVVDNLSGGRVGLSFASGWQPNDFVIRPEAFASAKSTIFENAQIVQKLWRGESVEFENPHGTKVPVQTLPRPVQEELPTWITTAGNVETFKAAGAAGLNVLTHLLGQNLQELAVKIQAYRQAAAEAGHDPEAGTVTCMLHTFVGEKDADVREIVREPMKDYLASSMALVVDFAWSFPAFERPGGPDSQPEDVDLKSLSGEETDAILEFAFERYYETSGLFGTPDACERMLESCKDADIDEIACLIDFGVDTDVVLGALDALDAVRRRVNEAPVAVVQSERAEEPQEDHSFAAQVERHDVTHLQCTPSHATMLLTDPQSRAALARIPNLMIGGEAFPVSLAAELGEVCHGRVTNMYGPTETTIWSTTEPVQGRPDVISIGRPIANTQLYVLDSDLEPLPGGISGELWIGGEGVVRGYHERPDLTAERFVKDPFSDRPDARMYRTGDLARWTEDGRIDVLGRLDHQVKIRGYRIELGEIEARLASHPDVREGVVIAREDVPGDVRLVGYVRSVQGSREPLDEAVLREALRETLPEFMVPSTLVQMERFPQTPNGKVDRKALPAPHAVQGKPQADYRPPENELEIQISEVWSEALHLEKVGVNDNFFDLGGHSLLVVQAHRKLRAVLSMPITLTDLYRFPTVTGLAEHLASGDGASEVAEASQARGEKRRQALGRRRRRGGPRN